jgi:hypothetical protein
MRVRPAMIWHTGLLVNRLRVLRRRLAVTRHGGMRQQASRTCVAPNYNLPRAQGAELFRNDIAPGS